MHKIFLLAGLLIFAGTVAFGQCPTAGFNLPDSVCSGTSFQVINTSSGGTSFYWDLCPGELNTIPTTSDLANFGGLNAPQQIRLIKDNGNYYVFVANLGGNNILRYDFGNSTDNVPVVYDYGNPGFMLNGPAGIDLVLESGTWYALVANYSGNNLIRLNLGSTISANSVAATDLGLFGMSLPIALKIAFDGTNYFAFISNTGGSTLTRVDMGNSITNVPSGSAALTDANFNTGWQFEVAYDCIAGKWVGFYASFQNNKINVIDFGNSLSNSAFTLGADILTGPLPTALALTRDGTDWHLLSTNIGNLEMQNFKFSGSLLSPPVVVPVGFINGITSPRGLCIYRDSTSFSGFMALNQTSNIKQFKFTKPCAITPAIQTFPGNIDLTYYFNNAYAQVTLEVTGPNGETSVFGDSIYVSEAPIAGFTHSLNCEGLPIQFNDTSLVNSALTTTWQWDFGDASGGSTDQNPVHLYSGTGTFAVSLTTSYAGGCSNTFVDSITIHPYPDADFSFLNNQCSGTAIQFNDLSQAFAGATISDWIWDFGDTTATDSIQNPGHIYNSPGTYTVFLTIFANTGCSDTISKSITIIPAPVADFTIASTCVGETVSFTNNTTIQGGGTLTYDWDFGDTAGSALEDPTHAYAPVTGNYLVTLVAIATNGCQDTLSDSLRISNKPVADFTFSPQVVCKTNPVSFISTSTGTGGDTISTYIWDFGDSGISFDQDPFHAFADTGFYTITLTVVSPTACDSTITKQLYVIPSPTATFNASNVCLGGTTSFSPSTTTPPGTQIDSIVWDFGDSVTFNGLTSPTHIYSLAGSYPVSMTVYNNLLCTASFIDTVEVYPIPVADFTTNIVCSDSLTFYDGSLSQVAGDSITNWQWNFDGLGFLSGETVQFSFPDASSYEVTLIVTTQHGCQDTTADSVTVIQSPEFDFVFNEPCFGLPSTFTYLPDIIPAPPSILTWYFGDGFTANILSPDHTYGTVDTFFVSLRVEHNTTGCAATVIKPLIVKPYPAAGFTHVNNCQGLPVQLNDTSTILTGIINSWNWNFGSLGTSGDPNPVISSNIPGTYPATLTVTSAEGCAKSVTDSVIVYANPVAAFTPDPVYGSPPLIVNFTNTTTGGANYAWTYGDGATGAGISPSHIFQDTGVYNITMVAESAEGCLDSVSHSVSVLIPYLDVAVSKVFASQNGQLMTLSAEISNYGNIPVTEFTVSGIIENGSTIDENWTGYLLPGAATLYEFNSSYNLGERTLPSYYCVEVLNPNGQTDAIQSNNSKCAVIGNSFELYNVYPNPFDDQFSLGFNLPVEDVFDLFVYDISGKLVYEKNSIPGNKGYNRITVPAYGFAKGVYAVGILYRDELKVQAVTNYR